MTNRSDPSRRDFVALSTFSLLGLASGAPRSAWTEESQPDGMLFYVGTYTEGKPAGGVYLVRIDLRSGALRLVGAFDAGPNPSFLAIHPNGRVLYAVNEIEQYGGSATGSVTAFTVARDTGTLSRINQQPSGGGAPCYVSVDRGGRAAFVANYVGGSVALLPIRADGSLAAPTHVVQHVGKGPNAQRQEAPHAHCVVADPSNKFVLAADLGIDRVLVYHLDVSGGQLHHLEQADALMRPGAGPRHLVFHPTRPLVFVVNELDSTVAVLRIDGESGKLSAVATQSTLPAGWSGTNYPADIHVAPSGRSLYVSNRGHDSIAVFSVDDRTDALALEQVVSTGGDWPRNFTLDPTGRWLLVANQRSDSLVVFARDEKSGRLTPTSQRLAVPRPVCLRFRTDAA